MQEQIPVTPLKSKDISESSGMEENDQKPKMKVETVSLMEGKINKISRIYNQGFSQPWMLNLKNEIKWVVLDDNLIIGDINDHIALVQGLMLPDNGNVSTAETWSRVRSAYRGRISAAGICNKKGEMVGWKSDGFEVNTPEAEKHELTELIKQIVLKEKRWTAEEE